jgi:ketosteroid isomerase-like protein
MGPNEKALREGYRRFSSGEENSVYEYLAPDVKWHSSGKLDLVPTAGEHSGIEGVREYFTIRNKEWSIDRFDVKRIFCEADEHFAVHISCGGRHKRTAGRVMFEKIDLITMKNGKIVRFSEIMDTALLERCAAALP